MAEGPRHTSVITGHVMPESAKDSSKSVVKSISSPIMTVAASPWKQRESTHELAMVDSVAGSHPAGIAMAQGIEKALKRGGVGESLLARNFS